nr:hypothetical protein [uncultured Blautia sp.]
MAGKTDCIIITIYVIRRSWKEKYEKFTEIYDCAENRQFFAFPDFCGGGQNASALWNYERESYC